MGGPLPFIKILVNVPAFGRVGLLPAHRRSSRQWLFLLSKPVEHVSCPDRLTPRQQEMSAEEECRVEQIPDQRVAEKGKRRNIALRQARDRMRIHLSEEPGGKIGDQIELHGAQKRRGADS